MIVIDEAGYDSDEVRRRVDHDAAWFIAANDEYGLLAAVALARAAEASILLYVLRDIRRKDGYDR